MDSIQNLHIPDDI